MTLSRAFSVVSVVGVALALAACVAVPKSSSAPPWRLHGQAMAAAADPRAVDAAIEVLQNGGHAVDAAIAAHAVLGLVEPQSSGLGGGAFMVVYQRSTGKTTVYDGRETAPQDANANLFMRRGKPMPFVKAWQGGISVGTPGTVALYKIAHDAHGTVAWKDLFSPARDLARKGFVVSPRLASRLANKRIRNATRIDNQPLSAVYFYPGGTPLRAGQVRDNQEYADLLDAIAIDGPAAFYTGPIARDIVARTAAAPEPGSLSLSDLANYSVRVNNALCGKFRNFTVCSAPPPSSGGMVQPAILGLYDRLSQLPDSNDWIKTFVDAQRLAYADRDHYIADPSHAVVQVEDLINPLYLDARANDRFAPDQPVRPGDPGQILRNQPVIDRWALDLTVDSPGTTHLSVVDFEGNVVSMTATIESAFGSSRMTAGGFLLNNELTDFAFVPEIGGRPVANAPGPGKRPRSSMSPTIVFDANGDFVMATGSPGGNSIIAYVSKSLLGVLDQSMNVQQAVDLPNVIARGNTIRVETGVGNGQNIARRLRELGYRVKTEKSEISGLHAIVAGKNQYQGGADSRGEGVARAVSATGQ